MGRPAWLLRRRGRSWTSFPKEWFLFRLPRSWIPNSSLPGSRRPCRSRNGPAAHLLDLLAQELGRRRLLLVLDNFEHVLAAATRVSELLNAAPGMTMLVTSRTLLRLAGEREFPLMPLAVPDVGSLLPLDRLLGYGAVALFVERPQTARSDFELTIENAPFVVEICQRLDGLPLALELAAARVRLLSPESLLRRLDESLTFLTGGARDRAPHQQGLLETLEWSLSLLEPPEQRLFSQLGVFAGGFTVNAAEAVCGSGAVVEGLGVLLESSLVRRATSEDAEPRFTMLGTIRDFALDRLEQSGDAVRLRHAEHFAALVERAEPELEAGAYPEWIARLDAEHDNLRAALRWTLDTGRNLLALRAAGPLWRFWRDQGYLSEGRRWLEEAVTAGADQPAEVQAKALRGLSNLLEDLGELDAARVRAEAALALYEEQGDAEGIGWSLHGLGLTACHGGDLERGLGHLEKAANHFRKAGSERGLAYVLGNHGYYTFVKGDHIAATASLNEALPALRGVGDVGGQAWVNENLALIALSQGRIDDGVVFLMETLALCRQWQLQDDIAAIGLVGAASIAADRGEFPTVARLIGAEDAWRETAGFDHHGPFEEAVRKRTIDAAQAELGETPWEVAFAEGRKLGLQEAVDEAMRVLEAAK